MRKSLVLLATVSLTVLAACQKAVPEASATTQAVAEEGSYLPDPDRQYPTRVLWGDQHLHTGWSMDAGVAGATLTPEDRTLTDRMFTAMQHAQDRLLAPLDEPDRKAFMASLVRLVDANNQYGRASLRAD